MCFVIICSLTDNRVMGRKDTKVTTRKLCSTEWNWFQEISDILQRYLVNFHWHTYSMDCCFVCSAGWEDHFPHTMQHDNNRTQSLITWTQRQQKRESRVFTYYLPPVDVIVAVKRPSSWRWNGILPFEISGTKLTKVNKWEIHWFCRNSLK